MMKIGDGTRTDGGKYVRNSGILLNAVGPDGGAGGTWMSCVECQLAQGCVGDLIVIRGKAANGEVIPVKITSFNLDFGGRRARLGVIEDLTERMQAEERARQSERRYRELLAAQGPGSTS